MKKHLHPLIFTLNEPFLSASYIGRGAVGSNRIPSSRQAPVAFSGASHRTYPSFFNDLCRSNITISCVSTIRTLMNSLREIFATINTTMLDFLF